MSSYPQLELLESNVAVICLGDSENRLDTQYLTRFLGCLDQILNDEKFSDCNMVVTAAKGRFYSNGIDLEWLVQLDTPGQIEFVKCLHSALARLLTFPLVTVAALNGHAFAGGALLALAHDSRVMEAKRGWMCMPEVHLELPFRPGMQELLRCKTPSSLHRDFILFGHRFTADHAQQAGLIDTAVSATTWQQLIQAAVEQGNTLLAGRFMSRNGLGMLKSDLYASVVKALLTDPCVPDPRITKMLSRL